MAEQRTVALDVVGEACVKNEDSRQTGEGGGGVVIFDTEDNNDLLSAQQTTSSPSLRFAVTSLCVGDIVMDNTDHISRSHSTLNSSGRSALGLDRNRATFSLSNLLADEGGDAKKIKNGETPQAEGGGGGGVVIFDTDDKHDLLLSPSSTSPIASAVVVDAATAADYSRSHSTLNSSGRSALGLDRNRAPFSLSNLLANSNGDGGKKGGGGSSRSLGALNDAVAERDCSRVVVSDDAGESEPDKASSTLLSLYANAVVVDEVGKKKDIVDEKATTGLLHPNPFYDSFDDVLAASPSSAPDPGGSNSGGASPSPLVHQSSLSLEPTMSDDDNDPMNTSGSNNDANTERTQGELSNSTRQTEEESRKRDAARLMGLRRGNSFSSPRPRISNFRYTKHACKAAMCLCVGASLVVLGIALPNWLTGKGFSMSFSGGGGDGGAGGGGGEEVVIKEEMDMFVVLPLAPSNLGEKCDPSSIDSEDGFAACETVCSVAKCCFETDGDDALVTTTTPSPSDAAATTGNSSSNRLRTRVRSNGGEGGRRRLLRQRDLGNSTNHNRDEKSSSSGTPGTSCYQAQRGACGGYAPCSVVHGNTLPDNATDGTVGGNKPPGGGGGVEGFDETDDLFVHPPSMKEGNATQVCRPFLEQGGGGGIRKLVEEQGGEETKKEAMMDAASSSGKECMSLCLPYLCCLNVTSSLEGATSFLLNGGGEREGINKRRRCPASDDEVDGDGGMEEESSVTNTGEMAETMLMCSEAAEAKPSTIQSCQEFFDVLAERGDALALFGQWMASDGGSGGGGGSFFDDYFDNGSYSKVDAEGGEGVVDYPPPPSGMPPPPEPHYLVSELCSPEKLQSSGSSSISGETDASQATTTATTIMTPFEQCHLACTERACCLSSDPDFTCLGKGLPWEREWCGSPLSSSSSEKEGQDVNEGEAGEEGEQEVTFVSVCRNANVSYTAEDTSRVILKSLSHVCSRRIGSFVGGGDGTSGAAGAGSGGGMMITIPLPEKPDASWNCDHACDVRRSCCGDVVSGTTTESDSTTTTIPCSKGDVGHEEFCSGYDVFCHPSHPEEQDQVAELAIAAAEEEDTTTGGGKVEPERKRLHLHYMKDAEQNEGEPSV